MTYSIDLREAALSYINNGGSKVEVSRLFGFSRNTLYRWLGSDDLHPKPSQAYVIVRLIRPRLRSMWQDHPDMFLHERAEVFGVHTSSISRAPRFWALFFSLLMGKKRVVVLSRNVTA